MSTEYQEESDETREAGGGERDDGSTLAYLDQALWKRRPSLLLKPG